MASKIGKILVVDDNLGIRRALEILLPVHFAEVKTIPSPATLVSSLEQFRPDVVLLDMNFNTSINTGNEGLYWAGEIKKMVPDVEVVLFTAYADIALAVEGMKRGAFDFLVKPWENEKLIEVLTAARDKARKSMGRDARSGALSVISSDSSVISSEVEKSLMFWGASQPMAAIRKTLDKIAPTDATVLITGENGTGKDVLAKEIHAHSLRSEKPMVAVDAGAITETLFESELFGHVKGAFTDAHTDHMGKFEQADGGTLFLDEIGNIPLHLQAKLLRAIQNRSIVRVGGTEARPINIRLICATNMDLEALVRQGRFREDLYYRINTGPAGGHRSAGGNVPAPLCREVPSAFDRDCSGGRRTFENPALERQHPRAPELHREGGHPVGRDGLDGEGPADRCRVAARHEGDWVGHDG